MIKKRKWPVYIGMLVIITLAIIFMKATRDRPADMMQETSPIMGSIQTVITSTGTVQPQNRLEIKPPINGRIDDILVKEGQAVKAGQTLAWMSSTERAALLDAARARGPEEMKYWKEVYKPTPLIAPIDGDVIVSKDEPGQTVTSADVVIVLSDRLIVQAQVDETDIGKIKVGQEASVSLDAYPKIKISGTVDHIYYESLIVNNVTIYQVDIRPEKVPDVFRSGMSATVNIIEETKDGILTLPVAAVHRGKEGAYVFVKGRGKKPDERKVQTGISDEKNIEIVSGLTTNDKVLMAVPKYKAKAAKAGTNPLSPFGGRRPR